MLRISNELEIPESELTMTPQKSQGPGGQNVNKVATAIHLRFDIAASDALPAAIKDRLMQLPDRRISAGGVVNIKAQRSRSQDKNRADALQRLADLIRLALEEPRPRKKTKPGRKAKEKRLAEKSHRSELKKMRGRIDDT